ncbi:MAG: RNA methyltransferase [Flavobacteriales bacterium]|nr:RNA methyltransferase [Flavobacteriales bacterium]
MREAEFKLTRALLERRHRRTEGAFLVQGRKLVGEALRSGWPVRFVVATEEAARTTEVPEHLLRIAPPHRLERLGTFEQGNELIAVVDLPPPGDDGPLDAAELVLALDGVADPGNLGTIIRLADWFGIRRIWCAEGSVDPFNPKTVQASMGSVFRVNVFAMALPDRLSRARGDGAQVYAADMTGAPAFEVGLRRPAVLVLGSESHGLSDAVRGQADQVVRVPGGGGAESLNVAMAATALCMEFARRRQS